MDQSSLQQQLQDQLEKAQKNKDREKETALLKELGDLYSSTGKTDIANDYYQQALTALEELAATSTSSGEVNRAIDYYKQATNVVKDRMTIEEVAKLADNEEESSYIEQGGTIEDWSHLLTTREEKKNTYKSVITTTIIALYVIFLIIALIGNFSLVLVGSILPMGLALIMNYYYKDKQIH